MYIYIHKINKKYFHFYDNEIIIFKINMPHHRSFSLDFVLLVRLDQMTNQKIPHI